MVDDEACEEVGEHDTGEPGGELGEFLAAWRDHDALVHAEN